MVTIGPNSNGVRQAMIRVFRSFGVIKIVRCDLGEIHHRILDDRHMVGKPFLHGIEGNI